MQLRPLLFVVLAAFVVACGGGKSERPPVVVDAPDDDDDDPTPDASPPTGDNALGQLCPAAQGGQGTMCPAGNSCVVLQGLGSQITGYCTPDCMNNTAICTTGYMGPAGGMPQCALSTAQGAPPNGCAIVCTQTTQCPTGLSCTPVPGQQVSICVAP